MATPTPTRPDGSSGQPLGRLVRSVFNGLVSAAGGLGALGILLLLLLICADVSLRYLFNSPIRGVAEIVSLSIVGIVFLQLGRCLRADRFTRADVLINLIARRSPKIAAALNGLYCLCGAAVFGALVYGSIPSFISAYTENITVGVHGQFVAPVWPVRAIIVIGSTFAVILYLSAAWRHFVTALRGNAETPGGDGPRPTDAAI